MRLRAWKTRGVATFRQLAPRGSECGEPVLSERLSNSALASFVPCRHYTWPHLGWLRFFLSSRFFRCLSPPTRFRFRFFFG